MNSLILPETGHIYCARVNIYALQQIHSLARPNIKQIQTIKTKLGGSEESRQGVAVFLHSKI